jgi:bacteriocin-like protein
MEPCEDFSELAHINLGHLGLHIRPPAHSLVRQEGPKMTNDSKDTKPSTIAENKKTQLTEEELKKVSGGKLSDPEEGGQVRARPK